MHVLNNKARIMFLIALVLNTCMCISNAIETESRKLQSSLTFSALSFPVASYQAVAISGSGRYISAVVYGGNVLISDDYGNNYDTRTELDSANWYSTAVSSSGQYIAAGILGGNLFSSIDFGKTFKDSGNYDFWTGIAISPANPANQVGLSTYFGSGINGYFYWSNDFGSTWTYSSNPVYQNLNFQAAALSVTGSYMTVVCYGAFGVVDGGYIYRYVKPSGYDFNSEPVFDLVSVRAYYTGIAMSANGQFQAASMDGTPPSTLCPGGVTFSSDYGITWSAVEGEVIKYQGIAMDSTGQYVSYVETSSSRGGLFSSADYGATFVESDSAPKQQNWIGIVSDVTGKIVTGAIKGGLIYSSGNAAYPTSDPTQMPIDINLVFLQSGFPSANYYQVASSADGRYIAACASSDHIFVSSDFGATVSTSNAGVGTWNSIAVSSSGQYMTAVMLDGFIYISLDYGLDFSATTTTDYFTSVYIAKSTPNLQVATSTAFNNAPNGYFYYSKNAGQSWTFSTDIASQKLFYKAVATSDSGSYVTAVCFGQSGANTGGFIYVTNGDFDFNSNPKFTKVSSAGYYTSVAVSSSGQYQVASLDGTYSYAVAGGIALSVNFGSSWNVVFDSDNVVNYNSITMDTTGKYIEYAIYAGGIYTSSNFGVTFTRSASASRTAYWNSIVSDSSGESVAAAIKNGRIFTTAAIPTTPPTKAPTKSPTLIKTSAPTTTDVPTLKPTAFVSSSPTLKPTVTVGTVKIILNVTIDNYGFYNEYPGPTTLDQSTIDAIVYTTARSLDLQNSASVSCNGAGWLSGSSVITTSTALYPLEGAYANLSPDTIYITASTNLHDAIVSGTFTNLLQYSSKIYKAQATLGSTVTKLADFSQPTIVGAPLIPNVPTFQPTNKPVYQGSTVTINADITIDGFNNAGSERVSDSITLSQQTITSVMIATSQSLGVVQPASVTCSTNAQLSGSTVIVNTVTTYPLSGAYAGETANSILGSATYSLNTAVSNGDFTMYLQAASKSYSSTQTSSAVVTQTPVVSSPDTTQTFVPTGSPVSVASPTGKPVTPGSPTAFPATNPTYRPSAKPSTSDNSNAGTGTSDSKSSSKLNSGSVTIIIVILVIFGITMGVIGWNLYKTGKICSFSASNKSEGDTKTNVFLTNNGNGIKQPLLVNEKN